MSNTLPIFTADASRIAFQDESRRVSFKDVQGMAQRTASHLRKCGLTPGSRVAILAEASLEVIFCLQGIHYVGASAVMLNARLLPTDWLAQLELAETSLVLVDSRRSELPGSIIQFEIASLLAEPTTDSAEEHPFPLVDDQEAVLIFTSGSSGHTKGVRLSHANLRASATASNEITGLSHGDTWLVSLPLYHLGGLGIIYRTMYAGANAFITSQYSDQALARILATQAITHLSLVPTQLELLIDSATAEALARIKAVVLAGAPSSTRLIEKIIAGKFPVLSAYGMTETSAHCCCMRLDDPIERITTVGKAFSNTEIEVVDSNLQTLPAGQVGEIRFRGPTVCLGLLAAEMPRSADGWLYSGDLGVFDSDGYLSIVGRVDSMFISGGENIHPAEIEAAALLHSDVQQAATVAVDHPTWGKRPILFALPKANIELTEESLLAHLSGKLARIKMPDRVLILSRWPTTAIGKTDYQALRELLN